MELGLIFFCLHNLQENAEICLMLLPHLFEIFKITYMNALPSIISYLTIVKPRRCYACD
jgi:hypothetical protein